MTAPILHFNLKLFPSKVMWFTLSFYLPQNSTLFFFFLLGQSRGVFFSRSQFSLALYFWSWLTRKCNFSNKITCWVPWILQVQSTGVPSIFCSSTAQALNKDNLNNNDNICNNNQNSNSYAKDIIFIIFFFFLIMQASIEWSTIIHKTSCKSQSLLGGNAFENIII